MQMSSQPITNRMPSLLVVDGQSVFRQHIGYRSMPLLCLLVRLRVTKRVTFPWWQTGTYYIWAYLMHHASTVGNGLSTSTSIVTPRQSSSIPRCTSTWASAMPRASSTSLCSLSHVAYSDRRDVYELRHPKHTKETAPAYSAREHD